MIWLVINRSIDAIVSPDYTLVGHIARAVSTALIVGLFLVLLSRRDRPGRFGLAPTRRTPAFLGIGAALYAVPFAVGAAIVLVLQLASITFPAGAGAVLPQALLVLALVLLFEAIPEELIFRGYLFSLLAERLPMWAVVLVQAVAFCLFGAVIGAAVTFERQLAFFLFSIALGIIRAVTGSVYATIGFHSTFQLLSQLTLNPQWTSVQLDDPDAWFTDLAFGLAPLVISPLVVLAAVLLRRRRA